MYRRDKSLTLMSQLYLLQTLKHLQNLKVLSRQKRDLKKRFRKILSSLLSDINSIQNKMPTPEVPEIIKKHEHLQINPKIVSDPKPKGVFSRREKIDEELRLIQSKLKELNS